MEVDWTILTSVLLYLVAGGSVYVVGYALSWVAENFEFWHKLPAVVKTLVPIVVSVLIAFGAQQLLQYPDLIALVQPYWQLAIVTILAWLGSQKGYLSAKSADYGAAKRLKG